jgi:hypothetical protein
MRLASIAVLAVAAALAAGLQPAGAIHNDRYCMRGSSAEDCSYHTMKQCLASAHGLGGRCFENPSWRRPRRGGR